MDPLKRKIISHLENNKITTSEFERKAGLGNAAISRILGNVIKNPTIDTMIRIADVLECSLDELFKRKEYNRKHIFNKNTYTPYKNELFRSICLHVIHFISINNVENISLERVGLAIEEIYLYCLEQKLDFVNTKFADWILRNTLFN